METGFDRPSIRRLALVVIGYHLIAFCTVQILLHQFHGHWITSDSLVRWDAAHYEWIAAHGYVSFRQAFFPLFPLLWKFTSLDATGVSILNGLLYLACIVTLAWYLGSSLRSILIWMALPSAIFFFVPYSEAIFFAGALSVILSIRKKVRTGVAAGLLICTLSRPAFTTLLPSVILVSLITSSKRLEFFKDTLVYILISAFGVFLVSLIQHHFTDDWWGFYSSQQIWGNRLQWPTFPLRSWGGQPVTSLDAVAFLAGLLSLAYLGRILWFSYRSTSFKVQPEVLLSSGCIASISILTLFFRGGELFSLNRFVFATPFALVLIDHALKISKAVPWRRYIHLFALLLAYFLIFGAYVHIQTFLKFVGLSIYLLIFMVILTDQRQSRTWMFWGWLVIAFAIQSYFALSFLNNGWVA
jgi:hypothetical protein